MPQVKKPRDSLQHAARRGAAPPTPPRHPAPLHKPELTCLCTTFDFSPAMFLAVLIFMKKGKGRGKARRGVRRVERRVLGAERRTLQAA